MPATSVGPRGRVVGVEASLPLFALASEGLKRSPPFSDSAAIEARHGTAIVVLKELESYSLDCVIFDPIREEVYKELGLRTINPTKIEAALLRRSIEGLDGD